MLFLWQVLGAFPVATPVNGSFGSIVQVLLHRPKVPFSCTVWQSLMFLISSDYVFIFISSPVPLVRVMLFMRLFSELSVPGVLKCSLVLADTFLRLRVPSLA